MRQADTSTPKATSSRSTGSASDLLGKLRQERALSSAVAAPLSNEIRDEVEVLKTLEPIYRVWGDYSGAGPGGAFR